MYGLRVYPGIHLFIGRCCDFFSPPPVMNRISLEAYPLLPFISSSLFPPPFTPSLLPSFCLFLSLPPKAKLKNSIVKNKNSPTEMLQQSVSTNDVEAFEGYLVFSKSSTLCNCDYVLHVALCKQHSVCV